VHFALQLSQFFAVLIIRPTRLADGEKSVAELVDDMFRGRAPFIGAHFTHLRSLGNTFFKGIYRFLHAGNKLSPTLKNIALNPGLERISWKDHVELLSVDPVFRFSEHSSSFLSTRPKELNAGDHVF